MNMIVRPRTKYAYVSARRFALAFATIFGIVSPKMITRIVIVSVDTHA